MLESIRPYTGWLVLVFLAMLVETAANLAAPWPLKIVIDNVLGAHPLPAWLAWIGDSPLSRSATGLAALAAIATVLIASLGGVAGYVDSYYTESVGQWIANDLRMKVYHHLLRLSLTYYDAHQTSTMLSTITDDVSTIQDFASSATLSIVIDLLTIVGMLVLMFWLNATFAVVSLVMTPCLVFFAMRLKRAVKRSTREVRRRQSDILAVVQQGLESVRTVEAFGREDLEEGRLSSASQSTVQAALKARRLKSLLSPVVAIVVSICTGLVLWRGAVLILSGALTIGALTVFLAYLGRFFRPVQDLAKMTTTMAQAAVGLERTRAILDTDTVIPERPGAPEPPTLRGDIAFRHVAFAYNGESPVLRDVTFSIAAGSRIGIVGPTGCGKSTAVSLIPRFYDATGGTVTIDGVDVRDYQLHGLRAQIAFVLQDTVLFRGTVRDNIAYGRPGAADAEIVRAAELADADEFIARMPLRYQAMIGERGLTLSGGQRQRIGIARAVVRNSPILILDEPTAALDAESEKAVMEALERLMKGRTVITIAHRLSTVRGADRIIVLSSGVVAEEGTHDELKARGGVYADLYRLQSSGNAAGGTNDPVGAMPALSR